MTPADKYVLSIVASHTCTVANSIQHSAGNIATYINHSKNN